MKNQQFPKAYVEKDGKPPGCVWKSIRVKKRWRIFKARRKKREVAASRFRTKVAAVLVSQSGGNQGGCGKILMKMTAAEDEKKLRGE